MTSVKDMETRVREELSAALNDDDVTPGEKRAIEWQYEHMGFQGGFQRALWECLARADPINLERLRKGFPEDVQGYMAYMDGSLERKLKAKGLETLL